MAIEFLLVADRNWADPNGAHTGLDVGVQLDLDQNSRTGFPVSDIGSDAHWGAGADASPLPADTDRVVAPFPLGTFDCASCGPFVDVVVDTHALTPDIIVAVPEGGHATIRVR